MTSILPQHLGSGLLCLLLVNMLHQNSLILEDVTFALHVQVMVAAHQTFITLYNVQCTLYDGNILQQWNTSHTVQLDSTGKLTVCDIQYGAALNTRCTDKNSSYCAYMEKYHTQFGIQTFAIPTLKMRTKWEHVCPDILGSMPCHNFQIYGDNACFWNSKVPKSLRTLFFDFLLLFSKIFETLRLCQYATDCY